MTTVSALLIAVAAVVAAVVAVAAAFACARRSRRARDVLEESARQATLREGRFRAILDAAADGIVTADEDGIVREYNRAAESMFGVPATQAIGKPLATLVGQCPAELQGFIDRCVADASTPPPVRTHHLRLIRNDGRPMDVQVAVSAIVDQGKRLVTAILRDASALSNAEQRFRMIFERSGEPHLLFDSHGLVDCNDAALALLGVRDRSRLVGRQLRSLAPATQADGRPTLVALGEALAEARRAGTRRLEWTAATPGGRPLPVVMTLTPVALGEAPAMLVTWHDIAARHRYETELREARDQAESAALAKARFLATMSHELRTPMAGIIGTIDLLDGAAAPEERERYATVLRNSATALLTVLDDVLDYSKIEAGQLELESIAFDPLAVVREVVEIMSPAATARGNRLRLETPAGAGMPLSGDPTRLRQILFNLIGNAIKFTRDGSVTVTATVTRAGAGASAATSAGVRAAVAGAAPDRGAVADAFAIAFAAGARPGGRSNHELRIEVADTGVGIAPEIVPTLFQPFRQADSSTTRRFGGTGLGLAISRHLVELMHGRIGVDSEPGKGSRFWFTMTLPEAGDASEAPASADPAVVPPRGLRILLAEDNATNSLVIGTRLRRASHRVEIAEDGRQAVTAATRERYDVILMDMQMPELDGLGATAEIRRLPGDGARVPIIALTADALPESRKRYLAGGVDACLTKPVDWPLLDRTMAQLVSEARGARDGTAEATTAEAATAEAATAEAAAAEDVATADVAAAAGGDVAVADSAGDAERAADQAFERVRAELGAELHDAVLAEFRRSAESDLRRCTDAIAAGDLGAWRAAAHSMKGAAGSAGLQAVAALAARLERCDPADADDCLAALGGAVEAAFDARMPT